MNWKTIGLRVILLVTLNLINIVLCENNESDLTVPVHSMVFWANATVPFYIDNESFDEDQVDQILLALTEFEFKTCIRFRPIFLMNHNVHSLYITNKKGVRRCQYSTRGHSQHKAHVLVLGYNCLRKPDIETLLMKTMGFSFEHNRPIRDDHIAVLYENIELSAIELFTKDVSYPKELNMLPYDINSVMHFDLRERSRNGHPSFMIKDKQIGPQRRTSLSPLDIKKFSIVYGEQCRQRDKGEQVVKCEKYVNQNPNARRNEVPIETRRSDHQNLTVAAIQSILFTHIVSSTTNKNYDVKTSAKPIYTEKKTGEITVKKATKLNKTVPVSRSVSDSNDDTINLIKILNTSKRPSRYAHSYVWRPSEYVKPFSMVESMSPTFQDNIQNIAVETESIFEPPYFESQRPSIVKSDVKITLTDENKKFYGNTKWPGTIIKYIIADGKYDKDAVRNRLSQVNEILKSKTCVRLEEISSNEVVLPRDYIVFDTSDDFEFGYMGGKQIFGSRELFTSEQDEQHTALLVMAVLGFPLECSRNDRDDYIKVNMDYILPAKRYHFKKQPESALFALPYDYRSAAHPPWKLWRSKIGTGYSSIATYKRSDPDTTIMKSLGHHKELLSQYDIIKINSVYGTECLLFRN